MVFPTIVFLYLVVYPYLCWFICGNLFGWFRLQMFWVQRITLTRMTRWSPKETAAEAFHVYSRALLGPRPLVHALVTRAVHYYNFVLHIPTDITFVLVRCHVLRLELGCHFCMCVSNEIIRNQVFTVLNWNGLNMFEPNMDKKGSTLWLDVASGVLQTVEELDVKRSLVSSYLAV